MGLTQDLLVTHFEFLQGQEFSKSEQKGIRHNLKLFEERVEGILLLLELGEIDLHAWLRLRDQLSKLTQFHKDRLVLPELSLVVAHEEREGLAQLVVHLNLFVEVDGLSDLLFALFPVCRILLEVLVLAEQDIEGLIGRSKQVEIEEVVKLEVPLIELPQNAT